MTKEDILKNLEVYKDTFKNRKTINKQIGKQKLLKSGVYYKIKYLISDEKKGKARAMLLINYLLNNEITETKAYESRATYRQRKALWRCLFGRNYHKYIFEFLKDFLIRQEIIDYFIKTKKSIWQTQTQTQEQKQEPEQKQEQEQTQLDNII